MATIKIIGSAKKVHTRSIRSAANFFCDHLLKRLSKNVYVEIKLKKNLYKNTKCFGFATWTDDGARNHRRFEIEIDAGLGPVFLFRTLAHELVHVKQYARKELIDMEYGSYQKWQGTMFNEHMVDYKKLPWEIEAAQLEKELYELWKQHLERQGEKGEKVGYRKTT
jgi:hypothetical protein